MSPDDLTGVAGVGLLNVDLAVDGVAGEGLAGLLARGASVFGVGFGWSDEDALEFILARLAIISAIMPPTPPPPLLAGALPPPLPPLLLPPPPLAAGFSGATIGALLSTVTAVHGSQP